jgi:hypothetical protein
MTTRVTTIPDPLIKDQSGNIVYYDSANPPFGSISNGGYQYTIVYNGQQKSDLFRSINILNNAYDVHGGNTFAYDEPNDKIYFFINNQIHTVSCSDFTETPVLFSNLIFNNPLGMEVDNSGNVYVSIETAIYKLDSTGTLVSNLLGQNNPYWIDNNGLGNNPVFLANPYDLVIYDGYLYMAQDNYMVTRFPLNATSRTQLEIVYDARYYLKDKAFQYDILSKQIYGEPYLYYKGDNNGDGRGNKDNWGWNWMYISTSAQKSGCYDKNNWVLESRTWIADENSGNVYPLQSGDPGYNAEYDNVFGNWADDAVYVYNGTVTIGTTKPWGSTNINIYDDFERDTIYYNDERIPAWANNGDLTQDNNTPDGAMHMKHLTIDKTNGSIYFTVEHDGYNYIYKVTIDGQNIRHCTELYKLPLMSGAADITNGLVMDASQNLYSLVSLNHTVDTVTTYESNIYKLGFDQLATRSQYYLDNSAVLVRTAPNPSLPIASTSYSIPNVVATGLTIDNTGSLYGGYGGNNVYQFTNQYIFRNVNLPDVGDLSLNVYNNTRETTVATINVNVVCFKEDSKILCLVDNEEKYLHIQHIKVGDLIKTYLHGYKKVELVGSGILHNSGNGERIKDKLYKYNQEDYPELTEDLVITGGHSILVDELSEQQKTATEEYWNIFHKTDDKYRLLSVINDKAIPYEIAGDFNIYHIALENDNESLNYGIYANGLLVESCSKSILTNCMKTN